MTKLTRDQLTASIEALLVLDKKGATTPPVPGIPRDLLEQSLEMLRNDAKYADLYHYSFDSADRAKEILTTFFAARLDEIYAEISEIEKSYRPGDGDEDEDITYYSNLSSLTHCARPLEEAMGDLHPPEGDGDGE